MGLLTSVYHLVVNFVVLRRSDRVFDRGEDGLDSRPIVEIVVNVH
jgi:hypothetical protein